MHNFIRHLDRADQHQHIENQFRDIAPDHTDGCGVRVNFRR